MILIIYSIIATIVSVYLLSALILRRRQIKEVRKQLVYLEQRNTQKEITLGTSDNEMIAFIESLNALLAKYRNTGLKIENKNNAFRETITSLSHDLRTPLTTANGYIQLLLELDLSVEQLEYVQITQERISAVKKLLDQLFEFARIEADELELNNEPVNLNNILRDTLATYYGDFEKKNVIPNISIPNEPFIILGDKEAIIRVFSNVIYNALLYGEGNYVISSKQGNQGYYISFSNLSNTVVAEDIAHIFDRFYTTDKSRSKKTTGLGLAIAKRLIEKTGGNITASLEDKTFSITILFSKESSIW
ncbi:sensor histidine kinase [Paenibacillus crassostreae]|uniref:histidine kinase n=1 Tax=Paenibacillus crassostreae TaxID=1763538 RepID=A0A167BCH0_9BACL|nr:HAMP domain-containing sensor histidine kinase [Paenibacillus crassostreae]AOZ92967.1 two-component sensor histidine kinase [Paenibacillus crassostreae]OAB71944.1 histidine kinase [Paenibacillus crassostreae]